MNNIPKKWLITIGVVLIFVLQSCNNYEQLEAKRVKDSTDTELEKSIKLHELNVKTAYDLTQTYHALHSLKDSSNVYSYQIQEAIYKDHSFLSFVGRIKDVTKEDTMYTLLVKGDYFFNVGGYEASISVEPSVFDKIKGDIISTGKSNLWCLIINPKDIVFKKTGGLPGKVTGDLVDYYPFKNSIE